jgi:hypothetical protein
MTARERTARTMFDYAADYQWMRLLGWTDDQLRSVPIHEEASSEHEMLNLSNFGGTALQAYAGLGDETSADARSIPNLWVYRDETPPALWQQLQDLVDRGGPSGYNEIDPNTQEVNFPP